MIAATMVMMMLVLALFPQTPVCRALSALIVAAPARWLNGLQRRQVIFVAIISLIVIAGAGTFAGVAAADLALLLAWDATLYIDTLVTVMTVAAATRGLGLVRLVRQRVGARLARPRARRSAAARARSASTPANDDDGGAVAAIAA